MEPAVCECELEFVLEVGHGAEAAHEGDGVLFGGEIDEQAIAATKRHILDCVGVTLAASAEPAGKVVLEDIEFSLDSVLRRSFDLVGQQARDKGLALVISRDPGVAERWECAAFIEWLVDSLGQTAE